MSFKETFRYHLKSHLFHYLFLVILFLLGIISGTYVVMRYSPEEVQEVTIFMEDFLRIFSMEQPDHPGIFRTAAVNMSKELCSIWLLGFTVVGVLGILLLIFRRGFLIGFLSAFFIKVYAVKGVGFSLATFSAQACFYVPALLVLSVFGLEFSFHLLRMVMGKLKYKTDLKKFILLYTGILTATLFIGCIYALCETYVIPHFIRILA